MLIVNPFLPSEERFRRRFMSASIASGIVLALVMVTSPGIDRALAAALLDACTGREQADGWCGGPVINVPRQFFMSLYVLGCVAGGLLAMAALVARKRWTALDQARCWFFVAALAIGPGLVANVTFKDNSGRARPRQVGCFALGLAS